VPEVEVEGGVGPDQAAPLGEGDLRLPEQDEPLVFAQDALDVGVLRASHPQIITRLRGRVQGGSGLDGRWGRETGSDGGSDPSVHLETTVTELAEVEGCGHETVWRVMAPRQVLELVGDHDGQGVGELVFLSERPEG